MLGQVCLATLTVASGRPELSQWVSQQLYYLEGLYKLCLACSKTSFLALWRTWHPCEPKQTSPTHLYPWFIIKMRLGVIPSAFLEWLHLVALGDHCGCGVLVILGGCCHLDGLEQRWRSGTYWWLFMAGSGVLVRGLVPSPAKSWKVTLVDCSCH
jgi:hypothetical protein